jgi:hypothetical protein
MNTSPLLSAVVLGTGLLMAACDSGKLTSNQANKPTYSSCLLSAVASGGELEAKDIRALCAEATGEQHRPVPSDEFTKCHDIQKKELEAKGVTQADRLAKLSCEYPEDN